MTKPGTRTLSTATIKAISKDFGPVMEQLAICTARHERERLIAEKALAYMREHIPAMVAFWEGEE